MVNSDVFESFSQVHWSIFSFLCGINNTLGVKITKPTYHVFQNVVYIFNTLKLIRTNQKRQASIIPHDTAGQMSNSCQWFLASFCYYWVPRPPFLPCLYFLNLDQCCFPNDHSCRTQCFLTFHLALDLL